MRIRRPSTRAGLTLLLLAALATPVLALAGLASLDLAGATRASPATMGALEADDATGAIAAPTGLVVTLLRTGG
jgi:hypothetical protein